MIDIFAKIITADQREINVTDQEDLTIGKSLFTLMNDLREGNGRVRVIALSPIQIVTEEVIRIGRCHVTYAGVEEHLPMLREALWYYTRHPDNRRLLVGTHSFKLEAICQSYRGNILREASLFNSWADTDSAVMWRRALLFASLVMDRADGARALALSDELFEETIQAHVDDQKRTEPFSDLLNIAESCMSKAS